jgi:hypothetical protein
VSVLVTGCSAAVHLSVIQEGSRAAVTRTVDSRAVIERRDEGDTLGV